MLRNPHCLIVTSAEYLCTFGGFGDVSLWDEGKILKKGIKNKKQTTFDTYMFDSLIFITLPLFDFAEEILYTGSGDQQILGLIG